MEKLTTKIKRISKNIAIVKVEKSSGYYSLCEIQQVCESYKVKLFGITLYKFTGELNER